LEFEVHGVPITQGSKRVGLTRGGRPYMFESNGSRLKDWRKTVTVMAIAHKRRTFAGACSVTLDFVLPRPKSNRSELPIAQRSGDIDKLQRACLDALTDAMVWYDDAQVTRIEATKVYAPKDAEPGVFVRVKEVGA
jgi:crossover junction endodeoxyribonuclease RusA